MVEYNILSPKNIEANKRLDAEYYRTEYLQLEEKLDKHKNVRLNKIAKITDGDHDRRDYTANGILFLRSQDIFEYGIIVKEPVYISDTTAKKLSRSKPDDGDILMTKTGSVGTTIVFNTKYIHNANIPADISRIKITDPEINPYFFSMYANTNTGRKFIYRLMSGSGRPRITLNNIKNIKIPILNTIYQEQIEQASKALYEYYYKSMKMLENEIDRINSGYQTSLYNARYETQKIPIQYIAFNHRIDAEFYNRSYIDILTQIKKNNFAKLIYFVDVIKPNFDPSKCPDQNFKYVELSDIDPKLGLINNSTEMLGCDLPSRAKRVLKENDIIISSVGGSLDKVAIVDKGNDGSIASNGFIQLRPVKINPEVLLLLAKSIVLQSQLKRYSTGTILASVNCNVIKNFIIPTFSPEENNRMSDYIKKSHYLRNKAIHLLEIIKHSLDIAIEEDESKAIEYLLREKDKIGGSNE